MEIAELLYCFKVEVPAAAGDLAGELLAAAELPFSSWEENESHRLFFTVYFESAAERDHAFDAVVSLLPQWREYGAGFSTPEKCEIARADWAEEWKKYFHPIEISDRLLVKPSWIKQVPKPGQRVLTLDPGMSFGTGQHATTLFCLETIDRLGGGPGMQSMLDAGCGSGILAMAAGLCGFEVVDAFDNDPDAVRVAQENIDLNGQGSMIRPFVADASVYPGREGGYDLVCANILGHLLRKFRYNIVTWVRPGKYLALAGILNEEFDAVSADFVELGFEELYRKSLREWTSGLFRRK